MAGNDDLIVFVRDALARGASRREVADVLKQAGWSADQADAALGAFAAVDFPVPVPRPRPSMSAREAFVYLLLFTTLYIVAFNLGSLIFQFINRAFPDPASPVAEGYARESIRWSVSSLVVALPIFLFLSRLTLTTTGEQPQARASSVRRWLTYLTLFNAACVLIGDVVGLIYNLLGGELTTRFALKALTVGAIAGAIFWYYLSDLRLDEREAKP
jgi:hypothetical protein